jgi:hypothetical protein
MVNYARGIASRARKLDTSAGVLTACPYRGTVK